MLSKMSASSKFSVFVLMVALLQNSVFSLTAFNYIRVEIDPDYASIKAYCSVVLQTSLQSQIQGWVNDGIALYFGQRNDQRLPYNLTYQSGWDGQWSHRNLEEQVPEEHRSQLRTRVQTRRQSQDRKLCSLSSCYKCCYQACLVYCACYLCGGSRRELDSSSFNTWSMTANDEVAFVVQVLASKWLSDYDSTGCMGNPWKASVSVSFVL